MTFPKSKLSSNDPLGRILDQLEIAWQEPKWLGSSHARLLGIDAKAPHLGGAQGAKPEISGNYPDQVSDGTNRMEQVVSGTNGWWNMWLADQPVGGTSG